MPDSYRICGSCGNSFEQLLNSQPQYQQPIPQQQFQPNIIVQDERYKRIFVEPNERLVCTLGNAQIQEYFNNEPLKKAFSVVSDKNVYFRGNSYDINEKFSFKKNAVSQAIAPHDITGITVSKHKIPMFFVLGKILTILGALPFLNLLLTAGFGAGPVLLICLVALAALLAGIYFLVSFFKGIELLTITFNGGIVSFNKNWFSDAEVDNYQRELQIAINNFAR
jgi:hypothetical protein